MVFETRESREAFYRDKIVSMEKELYYFALSILKNEQDARDVVQETLVTAWERLEQLRDPQSLRSWLMRVARNKAVDLIRAKSRYVLSDRGTPERGVFFSAEEILVNREARKELLELIGQLPKNYARILRLTMQGLCPKEICELLGISERVRSLLVYRARKSLRKLLDKMEHKP